ncbi:hypothetical protein HZS_1682 [Henneguya salminicola]|nr:hypothetical protein HZS_1682 [Henneguya salminicola]
MENKDAFNHQFSSFQRPSYCDQCQEFIWGLSKQSAYRCKKCKFTVHARCAKFIDVECSGPKQSSKAHIKPSVVLSLQNNSLWSSKTPNEEQIYDEETKTLVKQLNDFNKTSQNTIFYMNEDKKTFSGTLRIQINIRRPITVPEGVTTLNNLVLLSPTEPNNKSNPTTGLKRVRSIFYVPQGAFFSITTSSDILAPLVVEQIIKKYNIVCSPDKYCLFVQHHVENNTLISRIKDNECPLINVLKWGPNDTSHIISFEENDSADIDWDNFQVPELKNFLQIINIYEKQHICQTEVLYEDYRNLIEVLIKKLSVV